jgi:hypothetical protein
MSTTKTLLLTALSLLSLLSATPPYAPVASSVLAAPLARADDDHYTGPVLYGADGRIAMKFSGLPVAGTIFASSCKYTDPQSGSRRGEAHYRLRTDDGWTSDCDALRGRVVQHCPGARMAPPHCFHALNKLELRFGLTAAAERECAAAAITALSPAARANGLALPKCVKRD